MLVLIDHQSTIEFLTGGEDVKNVEEVAEKYVAELARLTGFAVEFGETAGQGMKLVPQTDADLDIENSAVLDVEDAMAAMAQDWDWAD